MENRSQFHDRVTRRPRQANRWSIGLLLGAIFFELVALILIVSDLADPWASLENPVHGIAALLALAAFTVALLSRRLNPLWSILMISPALSFLVPREIRESLDD